MMGVKQEQDELFNYEVNLSKRVRPNHPLRAIREHIDFTFVREEVAQFYGQNGNVSVDPAIILKLMFLLFYDNVPSERELMDVIGERLDYMWFLGYGLDDEIPNHSVLSKARKRWGVEVFESLFVRVVVQCVEAGLVGGDKIHMDGSLVDADASLNSVKKGPVELIRALKDLASQESEKLEEPVEGHAGAPNYKPVNRGLMSTTDPDAPSVRQGRYQARPRYKVHRAVDDAHGVITATETTPGDIRENAKLIDLVEQHERHTAQAVETVVADNAYGTVENFVECNERGIRSHMGDVLTSQGNHGRRVGIFGSEDFAYDKDTDTYRCPAGQTLTRRKHKKKRNAFEYACAKKVCSACALRDQCTKAKSGNPRTIKRHEKQERVDAARKESHSNRAKRDRVRRKWLMEGSFADSANNHGFKRSRWRRLHNQKIQDYLIAAIQNVRILMRHMQRKRKVAVMALWGERDYRDKEPYRTQSMIRRHLERFMVKPSAPKRYIVVAENQT